MRRILPLLALPFLGGCLLDLWGGSPRLQVRDDDTLASVAAVELYGTDSVAVWRQDFEPAVAPGALSRVFDAPESGALRLRIVWTDSSRTPLGKVSCDPGDFRLLVAVRP